MNKLIIVAIVLGVVGFVFREPLGRMVDQVKALGPKMKTEMDMRGIAGRLAVHIDRHGEPPGNFINWIQVNVPERAPDQPSYLDRYGTEYQIARDRQRGLYVLRSCGPDKVCFTEDDITKDVVPED